MDPLYVDYPRNGKVILRTIIFPRPKSSHISLNGPRSSVVFVYSGIKASNTFSAAYLDLALTGPVIEFS